MDCKFVTKTYMIKLQLFVVTLLAVILLNSAHAYNITCNTSDVWISSAIPNIGANTGVDVVGGNTIYSTGCEGVFNGNDKPLPSNNIGEAGDGLLNGADQTGGQTDPALVPNSVFDPGAFISNADLQDLDGDGVATDPGWLFLGKAEGGAFQYADFAVDLDSYIDILLSCSSDCSQGTWGIDFTDAEGFLAALSETVLGNSFFDHLAFVFKAGKEFAVYDFNFNLLNELSGNAFDLDVPHDLAGGFNLCQDAANQDLVEQEQEDQGCTLIADISHVSIWVRDPADVPDIPEPAPLFLLSLGLLAMVYVKKRNQA